MTTEKRVATQQKERRQLVPPVDIFDHGDSVVLLADMPGVDSKHVDINYDRGQLTVHGRLDESWSDGSYALQEFELADYHREFMIGDDIDPSGISAELTNGVLRLNLPKVKERAPIKIKVKG